jgi:hypothetical protein
MKTEICVFNGNKVSFETGKENNMMVNATEMAKIFGKQPHEFISNEGTRRFICAALKNGNSRFLGVEKEEDLFVSKQCSGTWMHRVLALKFAAWLNPDFEVWVYSVIDELLFGKHIKREQSLERSLVLKCEAEILAGKQDKDGSDFERYLCITNELRKERQKRRSLTMDAISDIQMEIKFLEEI